MDGKLSELTLLGLATIIGFYTGRVARRLRLPSLIGYMFVGLLLGVSGLDLFTEPVLEQLSFISEMALGFVALNIGLELSLSSLRRQGFGIVIIILSESFLAFAVVTGAIYLLTRDLAMALLFGAMAPASAPAGTVAVIQEYKARGSLTKALYAVVGFDDGLAIIIFCFASAFAKRLLIGECAGASDSILHELWVPMKEIVLSLLVGGVIGLAFCQFVRRLQNPPDLLAMTFGCVLVATGVSISLHLSLILTNLVVGFVLVNTRREALQQRVSDAMLGIMPVLFILFFSLAGAHLRLSTLPSLGVIGVVYIAGRSAGLMSGAWFGAVVGGAEEKIRKYLGMGILSQAGVAIGLSLIVKHELGRIGSEHAIRIGSSVLATITATCIFFEIVGPILTKIGLEKAGEISSSSE